MIQNWIFFFNGNLGKKVSTPYGKGTLLSTREEDKMVIVEMDWVLANNAKVIAYMNPSAVKDA